ncbi:hypothetical protein BD413DRAFT_263168 [Trametes elegans]|nr:hypothetical protein BD413DRAFT_263168 [Trametes elegans]
MLLHSCTAHIRVPAVCSRRVCSHALPGFRLNHTRLVAAPRSRWGGESTSSCCPALSEEPGSPPPHWPFARRVHNSCSPSNHVSIRHTLELTATDGGGDSMSDRTILMLGTPGFSYDVAGTDRRMQAPTLANRRSHWPIMFSASRYGSGARPSNSNSNSTPTILTPAFHTIAGS